MYAALSQQPANRPLSRIAVPQLVQQLAPRHQHPAQLPVVSPPNQLMQPLPPRQAPLAPPTQAQPPTVSVHNLGDPATAAVVAAPMRAPACQGMAAELMEISVTQYVLVLLVAAVIGMVGVVVSRVA